MSNSREAKFIAAVGRKGIGKTEETIYMALRQLKKNIRVLIFDIQNEYGDYRLNGLPGAPVLKIKTLSPKPEHIAQFTRQRTAEIRRIQFFNEDNTPMDADQAIDLVYSVLKIFKDGMVIMEDFTVIAGDHYNKDVIGRIISQRHLSVDIIVHFQYLKKILNPKIFGNLSAIRLHRCKGAVDEYRAQLDEDYELIKLAKTLVDKQHENNNSRFFVWVDLEKGKIYGKFTKQMFLEAVDEVISDNYSTLIRRYTEKKDSQGKKMYTADSALKSERQRLYSEYYGN